MVLVWASCSIIPAQALARISRTAAGHCARQKRRGVTLAIRPNACPVRSSCGTGVRPAHGRDSKRLETYAPRTKPTTHPVRSSCTNRSVDFSLATSVLMARRISTASRASRQCRKAIHDPNLVAFPRSAKWFQPKIAWAAAAASARGAIPHAVGAGQPIIGSQPLTPTTRAASIRFTDGAAPARRRLARCR
jgi:hypothetical protein